MKNLILFTLVALAALLGACRKDTVIGECPQVAEAPSEFLDYWFFPQGSYWVYRQRGSVPAVYDTVRGDSETRVFRPGQATYGLPTCVTLYEAGFSHSNRTFFRGVSSLQGFTGIENMASLYDGTAWAVQQSTRAGGMFSPGLLFTHPMPPPGTRLSTGGPLLLDTAAVTVPAGRFIRSRHFATPFRDSTTANYLRRFQLSRGVGYTRLVYTGIGTWELVAYRINR